MSKRLFGYDWYYRNSSIKSVFFISIIILLWCLNASSQTVTISGNVADSIAKTQLAYATITLFDGHDSIIGGTLSDERGRFKLNANRQTARKISISFVGYTSQSIAFHDQSSNNYKLGNIFLKPAINSLNSVEIRADVNQIEHKFEKTIMRPSRTLVYSSTNIYDVLRSLPGISVSESNNIRYRGFSPTIYVNNTPAFMLYPNLESIPPDMIEKIELIDAGMRSGGEGKGGIVNIILKKQINEGISGMVSAKPSTTQLKKIDNFSGFLNLNYKWGNNYFVSNSSSKFSSNDWGYEMTRTFVNSLEFDSLIQKSTQSTTGHSLGLSESIGYVYQPKESSRFTVAIAGDWNKSHSSLIGQLAESLMPLNNPVTQYNIYSTDSMKFPSKSIGLSYWHQFDSTERYIESNFYFSLSGNQGIFGYTEDYNILNTNYFDSIYSHSSQSQMKNCQVIYSDFTYYKPISSSMRWTLNYMLDANLNNHSILQAETNNLPLPLLSRDDNINVVFQNISWRIGKQYKKWKIDAGINAEAKYLNGYYTRTTNYFTDTTQRIDKCFIRIHPSVTAAYNIDNNQDIKIRFARVSSYPQFEQLLNYVYKNNSYDWQAGNPSLSPSEFYSMYCGYTLTRPKWYISSDVYYSYSHNMVTSVQIPVSSLTWIKKYYNIGNQKSIGISNAFWIRLKQFDISIYNDLSAVQFKVKITDSLFKSDISLTENTQKTRLNYSVNGQITYRKGNFRSSGSIIYTSRTFQYDGYEKGSLRVGISVIYSFANDKFVLGGGVSNLLRNLSEYGFKSTNFGIFNDTKLYGISYRPMFNLSFKYNILQGDRGTESVKGKR